MNWRLLWLKSLGFFMRGTMNKEALKKQIKDVIREVFDSPFFSGDKDPEKVFSSFQGMESQDPFDSLDKIENLADKVELGIKNPREALTQISDNIVKGLAGMSGNASTEDKRIVDQILIPIQEELDLVLSGEHSIQEFYVRLRTKIAEYYGEG